MLPNLREYDDLDLAESPSDSEELMALKFNERMRQKREQHKHEECEQREHEEREARERVECEAWEARERAEREEWEERDARERQSREERERSAREEVCRGKVSAQCFRRQHPWGTANQIFLSFLASGRGGLGRGHRVHPMP